MSILTQGIEMPSDCVHCFAAAIGYDSPLYSSCKLYCRAVDKFEDCATIVIEAKTLGMLREYQDRPDWCPLVEIPTPHGRLICEDDLLVLFNDEEHYGYLDVLDVRNAPTIVEAERGAE